MPLRKRTRDVPEGGVLVSGPRSSLADARTSAELVWTAAPDVSLDMAGPVDRPFDRMGAEFAGIAAIEHLRGVAERFADEVAVSDADQQITYAALLARVLALAEAIVTAAPDGQAVGCLLRNSIWHPIAMLACMAAGRPLVPLNPRDPAQRLAAITVSARLSVLIGHDDAGPAEWIEREGLQWLDVTRVGKASGRVRLASVPVDAPALVLYTSGSTGQPKGVVNSQRALLQRVQQYVDACHINATDVFMPLSGPTTIAGTREMLSALMTGARLHVADVESLGLRGLLRQIALQKVTVTYIVPALLRALAAAGAKNDFASLRLIRIGGEKLLWSDIALAREVLPPGCFIQPCYSSTETTGTQWFLPDHFKQQDFSEHDTSVPVGYVLPGISFAVVDDAGIPVRSGDVGELVIRSMYVILGYWENGHMLPTPPDPDDGRCRIFPTGDLVVVDARGLMQVVGRKGRQLKINGRRVEPAELETTIRNISYVGDAVAVVTDSNELVAFATRGEGSQSGFIADIRQIIRQTLPSALHPTRLHEIAEIPRQPGGKVDVTRLKALDLQSRTIATPAPQPLDPGQAAKARKLVGQVWTRILGAFDATGCWDEAGGDSLKLLRCVMELEELIGQELRMEAFTVDMSADDMVRAVAMAARSERPQRGDSTLPHLVMLPGSMGYGPSMAAFGARLSKLAHVIPIRYPDLASSLAGRGSVEDMAGLAIQQIDAAQPHGDVRLIGYSLGGCVAFEVASRLIARGRTVKFVGILDTNIEARSNQGRETLSRTLQRIRSHRVTLYRMLCRAVAKIAVRSGHEAEFSRILDAVSRTRLANTRFMLRLELEEVLRMRAFGRWVAANKCKLPIAGTLFLCNRRGLSSDRGWAPLFARLDIVPIAGGHLDLVVEPHLSVNLPVIERAVSSSIDP